MNLEFDEATHTYRLNGKTVPSVTQIIAPLVDYSMVDPEVLDRAARFGTAVHTACELYDQSRLDWGSLDPLLAPYLQAWDHFCRDTNADWNDIEVRLASENLKYAGTADRIGSLLKGNREVAAVVDIKTGSTLPASIGVQLAAYQYAANEMLKGSLGESPKINHRCSVQLLETGQYKLNWWTDSQDINVFKACLSINQYKRRKGI